jgi:DNA-directed RNA polymerase specialized sigma24 family protein
VLVPLIGARDDESRQEEIERLLIEHATPTIEMVIARFTRSEGMVQRQDADDLVATVVLRLVHKLRTIMLVEDSVIANFEHYVATLTYHAVHDLMRQRFPERTRLKNRIRYVLTHDARFAIWSAESGMVCGLRKWQGLANAAGPTTVDRGNATEVMFDRKRPHDAIAAVFQRAGHPLTLERLVQILAELWGIEEARSEPSAAMQHDPVPSHDIRYENRELLGALWTEIQALPQNQRTALLLNLRDRDGVNAIALFVLVGVARFEEIARSLGIPPSQLTSIWERLPLDDLTIAAQLNVTRQQVINLRRSARERLARRTNTLGTSDRKTG